MRYLFAILILLVSHPALAQPHPCDASPTALTTTSGPLALLFCAKPSDNITRADVILNGVTDSFTEAEAVAQLPPNADGYAQYRVPLGALPVGTYTIVVSVFNLDDAGVEQSTSSDPLTLTVRRVVPRPAKPKTVGVAQ